MVDRTWNGTQPNANIATAWTPNAIPSSSDRCIFNSTSTNACDWDLSTQVGEVQIGQISSIYGGTITASAQMSVASDVSFFASDGATLAMGSNTFVCVGDLNLTASNTFTAGTAATITVSTDLNMINGTLTLTGTDTFFITGNATLTAGTFAADDYIIDCNGTFTVAGGTLTFTGSTGRLDVVDFAMASGTVTPSAAGSDIQCSGNWLLTGGTWPTARGALTLTGTGNLAHTNASLDSLVQVGAITTTMTANVVVRQSVTMSATGTLSGAFTLQIATSASSVPFVHNGVTITAGVVILIHSTNATPDIQAGTYATLRLVGISGVRTFTALGAVVCNETLNLSSDAIFTTTGSNFALTAADIIVNSGCTLTANGSTITVSGDVDIIGTLDGGTSTITAVNVDMSAGTAINTLSLDVSGNLIFGSASDIFTTLTLAGTPAVSGPDIICTTGFVNTGTIALASGFTLTLQNAAISGFDNSSGTINGADSTSFLNFRGTSTSTFQLDNDGTINVDCRFGSTANSPTIQLITGSFVTTANVLFSVTGVAFTLDTNGQALTCVDLTLISNVTIDAGASTITATGNVDFSAGTFTRGTSTLDMSGGTGTLTVSSSAASFNNLTVNGNTLTSPGFSASTAVFNTFNGTGTNTIASTNLQLIGATGITNFTSIALINGGSTSTISFQMQGASATLDNIGTITNLNVTIEGTSGATNTLTLGAALTLTTAGNLLVRDNGGTNTTLDTSVTDFAVTTPDVLNIDATLTMNASTVTCGTLDCDGTIDASSGTSVIAVGGNADFTNGTYTSGTTDIFSFTATGNFTAAGNSFRLLQINAATIVVTLQDTLIITSSIQHLGGASELALNGRLVNFNGSGLTPLNVAGIISGTGIFSFNPTSTSTWFINTRTDYPIIQGGGASAATFQVQGNIGVAQVALDTTATGHTWNQQAFNMTIASSSRFSFGSSQTLTVIGGTWTGNINMAQSATMNVSGVTMTGNNTSFATIEFNADPTSLTFTTSTVTGAAGRQAVDFSTGTWTALFTDIQDCTFTAGSASQDLVVSQPIKVQINDCTLTNGTVSISNATAGLAVWGNVSGGSALVLLLWGLLDTTTDLQDSTPNGYEIRLFEDDGAGGNDCSFTVDTAFFPLSWVAEVGTTTTFDSTADVIIDSTTTVTNHTFGIFVCGGDFTFNPANALTFNIELLDTTVITSGGSFTCAPGTSATFELEIDDDEQLNLIAGGSLTLTGNTTRLLKVQNQQVGGGGNNGNIRLSGGTANLSFVELDTLGYNSGTFVASIYIDGATDGTVSNFSILTPAQTGIQHNSGNSTITFSDGSITGAPLGIRVLSTTSDNISFERIGVSGGSTGLLIDTNTFTGKIRSCVFDGSVRGGRFASDALNNVTNCAFTGGNAIEVDTTSDVELVSCMFDSSDVTIAVGSTLISWQHNRTNTKEVIILSNQTINSAYQSVVNEDTFDWSITAASWDINGANQFEAVSGTPTMLSIFIPTVAGTDYYVRFKGTIGTTTPAGVAVDGFEVDQSTSTGAGLSAFVQTGSDFEGTFSGSGNPGTVFIRFTVATTVLASTFFDIEVRETDSSGALVFNEDLINNYSWPGGFTYATNQLRTASGQLVFGDSDYNRVDAEAELDPITNELGFIFGWQDNLNYYKVFIDTVGTDTLRVVKRVAGVDTTIDTATNFDGGTSIGTITGSVIDFRVRWNEDISGVATAGVFAVSLNGATVLAADWVTSASNFSAVDTTYTKGKMAIYSDAANQDLDNLIVKHHGFFLRDVNLTLGASITLTVVAGGTYDYKDGTVNAVRTAAFFNTGGAETESNVTWIGDIDFDEIITGLITVECNELEIDKDIVIQTSGKLVATGTRFVPDAVTTFWTIKTETSTQDPPMEILSCFFVNLNTRFRKIGNPGGGEVYEIDQTQEFLLDAFEPIHIPHLISHAVQGRASHRNIIQGFTDKETTLEFATRDNCLYGFLNQAMNDEQTLEVVFPRGYIHKCRIIDLIPGEVSEGMNIVQFAVRLKEWR